MRAAGLAPDTFMKEYGAGQYEVTMGPAHGVAIADHSTILRELLTAVAARSGRDVRFTPIRDPAGVGNGVHVHLSFMRGGVPETWNRDGKHELTATADGPMTRGHPCGEPTASRIARTAASAVRVRVVSTNSGQLDRTTAANSAAGSM